MAASHAGDVPDLNPTADPYVQDGSTDDNKNFGTATTLQVKDSTTTGYNRQSYLKFNISSSPRLARRRWCWMEN